MVKLAVYDIPGREVRSWWMKRKSWRTIPSSSTKVFDQYGGKNEARKILGLNGKQA
jgi:hypothetical protein